MTDMTGKKGIVIGGASGIGAAVADAMASRGAEVVRASRPTGLDVSEGAALTSWIAAQGPVDHRVFSAGSQTPGGAIASLDLNAARAAFDTKFWGSIRAPQAIAPNLREGGTITITSGFLAQRTVPGTFPSTAMSLALDRLAHRDDRPPCRGRSCCTRQMALCRRCFPLWRNELCQCAGDADAGDEIPRKGARTRSDSQYLGLQYRECAWRDHRRCRDRQHTGRNRNSFFSGRCSDPEHDVHPDTGTQTPFRRVMPRLSQLHLNSDQTSPKG